MKSIKKYLIICPLIFVTACQSLKFSKAGLKEKENKLIEVIEEYNASNNLNYQVKVLSVVLEEGDSSIIIKTKEPNDVTGVFHFDKNGELKEVTHELEPIY